MKDCSKNEQLKIEEIYAFVSVSDSGKEVINLPITIAGIEMQCIAMPFLCVDKVHVEILRPYADKIAKMLDKKIKCVRVSIHEEI